jgi:hypothetical protein
MEKGIERSKLINLYADVTSKLMVLDVHLDCHTNDNIDFIWLRKTIKELKTNTSPAFMDILWGENKNVNLND